MSKQSDTDSIQTEDFVQKFADISGPKGVSERSEMSTLRHQDVLAASGGFESEGRDFDNESVKTEDFQNEFKRTINQFSESVPVFDRPRMNPSSGRYPSRPTSYRNPTGSSRNPRGIDNDSVLTEDFENHFRSLMVRGPPTTSYDDAYLEGLDSARSNKLKERVGSMFNIPASRVRLNDEMTSETETDPVDRRFYEIMEQRSRDQTRRPVESPLSRSYTLPRNSRIAGYSSRPAMSPIPSRSTPVSMGAVSAGKAYRNSPSPLPPMPAMPSMPYMPPMPPPAPMPSFNDEDEYSAEIRARSRQIQKELEEERRRRRRSPSPIHRSTSDKAHNNNYSLSPRETLDHKMVELDELTRSIRRAYNEKEDLSRDLEMLRDGLLQKESDARMTEKMVKDNKAKADDVRTELMLSEMKRDGMLKDLNALNDEMTRKKSHLRELEDTLRSRLREIKGLEEIGLSREEIDSVIAERDELYQLIRNNEESEFEKYELEKQVNMAKEELVSEQQRSRKRIVTLENELEGSVNKISELRNDRDSLRNQVAAMEERFRVLQDEVGKSEWETQQIKGEFEHKIKEKLEELNHENQRLQEEVGNVQRQRQEAEGQLQGQIQSLKEKIQYLKSEFQNSYETNEALRNQMVKLEHDLNHARQARAHLLEESEEKVRCLEDEKERAVMSLREDLLEDKTTSINDLRNKFDSERRILEDQIQDTIADWKRKINEKDEEVNYIRDRLRQLEHSLDTTQEKYRQETRERVRDVLAKEQARWEEDEQERWAVELANMREESDRAVRVAEDEARRQGEAAVQFERRLESLKKELEEEKQRNRNTTRETLNAIRRLKEVAKDETLKEIDRLRTEHEKTTVDEMGKLKQQLEVQGAHMEAVRAREAELNGLLDRLEKTLVHEVNQECTKMAHVLGVMPRLVNLSQFHVETASNSNAGSNARDSPVTAALANLEACGEEMRAYVEELNSQITGLKRQLEEAEEKRAADVHSTKKEMRAEKKKEMATLRERLVKNHLEEIHRLSKAPDAGMTAILKEKEAELERIQRGMQKWKEETAERLASKLQEEFKKEFDKKLRDLRQSLHEKDRQLNVHRREMDRMQRDGGRTGSQSSSAGEGRAAGVIGQLQERVRQLMEENRTLRSTENMTRVGGSQPNLASARMDEQPIKTTGSPDVGRARVLEERIKTAESQAQIAEERARQNQLIANKKIAECARLQQMLSNAGQASLRKSPRSPARPQFNPKYATVK